MPRRRSSALAGRGCDAPLGFLATSGALRAALSNRSRTGFGKTCLRSSTMRW
ncbi:hypothetical protein RHECNPAF_1360099 [Rhizobium etli CNPAF512]|nr:hypothetical protein RHECNPAF_1360099 [Rhizobium etli CNPAF512]